MSTEENKALIRRTHEAVNQGNLTAFFEQFTPDFVLHNGSMTTRGLEAFKHYQSLILTAFPDFHFTVEDLLAEGDKVAGRIRASGTHQGEFMGVPPTGKHWTVAEIVINRIVGGTIAEHWANIDMLGLMQQLGVVPAGGLPGQQPVTPKMPDTGEPRTSSEENKAILRRTYDAVNQGNLTAFFEQFTPDFVLHNGSMTIQGVEVFKQLETMLITALPDIHYKVEDLLAEGDKVAVRLIVTGTQRGELLGIPPTGKYTSVTESAISRIVGGKIAEHWSETDMLGLMQQLGVIPAPEQPG
jgi:predicted ester cyclase